MPYPGGKHAPGHYISSGIAHPWVFKSAASTVMAPLEAGRDANAPGGILANDLLHVSLFSSPNIVTPAGWTLLFSGNIDAYWRIATADANDDFAIPIGTDPETGRLVIFSCFRRAGEVPVLISFGAVDQAGGTPGPMIIADMPFDQSAFLFTLLIASTNRAGVVPVQIPAFTDVLLPWRNTITPLYEEWGGATDRFAYLGTAFYLEPNGGVKPASAFNWSQFEGSLVGTQSDSRAPRWDIV